MILEANAAPDIFNNAGETPLMLAVNAGNMQAMQLLLDYGAAVDFEAPGGAEGLGRSTLRPHVHTLYIAFTCATVLLYAIYIYIYIATGPNLTSQCGCFRLNVG